MKKYTVLHKERKSGILVCSITSGRFTSGGQDRVMFYPSFPSLLDHIFYKGCSRKKNREIAFREKKYPEFFFLEP